MAKRPTRNQIKKRANRKAQQGASADQAALDAARRSARKDYSTELGASRGAKKANLALIKEAKHSIPGRIHGLALQQIQSDLAGRMDDAQGMVKYEKVGLKADLQDQLASIREQQAALDAATAADAQSILHDSLARQREKQQADLKKRTEYDRQIKAALAEIRQSVSKTRGPGANALHIEAASLRSDPSLRRNLVDYLTTSQGISVPAAKKAVSLFTRGKNTAFDKAGLAATGFANAVGAQIEKNPLWWEDK